MSFTENVKNSLSWVKLKRHLSIGVFVVYFDTGSQVPNISSKSRGLADENSDFNRKNICYTWSSIRNIYLITNRLFTSFTIAYCVCNTSYFVDMSILIHYASISSRPAQAIISNTKWPRALLFCFIYLFRDRLIYV